MTPPRTRPPALDVLYLDPDLVVVDKPSGVLSAPGRGQYVSVADLLRARPEFQANPSLRIVHRLDREASGVQVYARTLPAQQHLVRQFAAHRVEKVYFALVSGYVEQDGEVKLALSYDRQHDRVAATGRGKAALTRYRIVERLASNTLLEVRPQTGRLHQIRAHMAAIGHPLTVDPLYGGGQSVLLSSYKPGYRPSGRHDERPLIDRLTLHAARITFVHPTSGQTLSLEAPVPKDMRATISQLGRLA